MGGGGHFLKRFDKFIFFVCHSDIRRHVVIMAEILSTRHNTAKNQSIKPSGQYFSQITVFIGSLLSDGQLFFTCTIKPL